MLTDYFNKPDVRQAFHVPSYVGPYDTYSNKTGKLFSWTRHGSGLINDVLKTNGYKMLHIFGNTDSACTLLGTRRWIKSLGWRKTEQQRPWVQDAGQDLVGYIHTWDNYQLVTLQGLGHGGMFVKQNETQGLVFSFLKNLKV